MYFVWCSDWSGALASLHCGAVSGSSLLLVLSSDHQHEDKIELMQKVQIILNFWSFFLKSQQFITQLCTFKANHNTPFSALVKSILTRQDHSS